MNKFMRTVFAAAALALTPLAAASSDHLDTAAVIADPAADIGDLYAWMANRRLNLVMTIVGGKFSDHVRYEFHVDSGRALGRTTATISIALRIRLRIRAGVRDDPFFNNVRRHARRAERGGHGDGRCAQGRRRIAGFKQRHLRTHPR